MAAVGGIRSIGSNFLCNAAQSFGEERETVCVSGFTGDRGHRTQNKKRKYYEKSKHSVQSNSTMQQKCGTSSRMRCGSVYVGAQSRGSSRRVAVQWRRLGVR